MNIIERLRELMDNHRRAVLIRQSYEDDTTERYNDACDMEDDARKELSDAAVSALPALLEIAKESWEFDNAWTDRQKNKAKNGISDALSRLTDTKGK